MGTPYNPSISQNGERTKIGDFSSKTHVHFKTQVMCTSWYFCVWHFPSHQTAERLLLEVDQFHRLSDLMLVGRSLVYWFNLSENTVCLHFERAGIWWSKINILNILEDRGTKKKNDSKVQQASVLIHIILQFLNMVTNYLLWQIVFCSMWSSPWIS